MREGMAAHERSVVDAALAILTRYLGEPGALFSSPQDVKNLFSLHLGAQSIEQFAVLYLDSQHRAIALETPFSGTLTQTSVYPREIVRAALAHDAAAVVLAHNHPSGSLHPSRADQFLTETLKNALGLVDVKVLDHIIVGGCTAISMVESGLI